MSWGGNRLFIFRIFLIVQWYVVKAKGDVLFRFPCVKALVITLPFDEAELPVYYNKGLTLNPLHLNDTLHLIEGFIVHGVALLIPAVTTHFVFCIKIKPARLLFDQNRQMQIVFKLILYFSGKSLWSSFHKICAISQFRYNCHCFIWVNLIIFNNPIFDNWNRWSVIIIWWYVAIIFLLVCGAIILMTEPRCWGNKLSDNIKNSSININIKF